MLKKCNISCCIREDRDEDGDGDETGGEEGRTRGQWVSVNGFGSALAAAECATHIGGVEK